MGFIVCIDNTYSFAGSAVTGKSKKKKKLLNLVVWMNNGKSLRVL